MSPSNYTTKAASGVQRRNAAKKQQPRKQRDWGYSAADARYCRRAGKNKNTSSSQLAAARGIKLSTAKRLRSIGVSALETAIRDRNAFGKALRELVVKIASSFRGCKKRRAVVGHKEFHAFLFSTAPRAKSSGGKKLKQWQRLGFSRAAAVPSAATFYRVCCDVGAERIRDKVVFANREIDALQLNGLGGAACSW